MKQKILSLMLICAFMLVSVSSAETTTYAAVYSADNPVPAIAERVRPAVVQVINEAVMWSKDTGEIHQPQSYGSGVLIDERGYIVTNNHVVDKADVLRVETLDGTVLEAELIGFDDGTDLAMLKVEEGKIKADPVPMGDSDQLVIGELAIAIGNPGDADDVLFGTVTCGIISALGRQNVSAGNFTRRVETIQTDAAINSGNSGGALLNAKGELIGIPTLKMVVSYDSIYEGLGFAIPVNTVKNVVNQLIDTGKVTRPRIGVSVATLEGPDEPLRKYAPAGAQVMVVEPGGPADMAGIRMYDIVTEINGIRVRDINDLTSEIDRHAAGESVHLKICRYFNDLTGEPLPAWSFYETDLRLEMLD